MTKRTLLSVFLLFALSPFSSFALPQNPKVHLGKVAPIEVYSNEMTVEASDRAIIHWDSFSINKQEIVRFNLCGDSPAILNRVIGNDLSKINGALKSNGFVYLINQNGILIGEEGIINTGGFLGSTLDLMDDAFLKRDTALTFGSNNQAEMINLGTIQTHSSDAILLGYKVKNEGIIDANHDCILAAGYELVLMPRSSEMVRIKVKKSDLKDATQIEQMGKIDSENTYISGNSTPYSFAIKSEGRIQASSIQEKGGKVFLVADHGSVKVGGEIIAQKNNCGSQVHLLGEGVLVSSTAQIDVSGEEGGGEVFVGRKNSLELKNTQIALVEEGAYINADATKWGSGGKVIVWGDQTSAFYGYITAKGGKEKGDGGFVEISSKGFLDPRGFIYTNAFQGQTGTVLYDPTSIRIQGSGRNNSAITWSGANPDVAFSNSNNATLYLTFSDTPADGLLQRLQNNNVIVDATAGTGDGAGIIRIDTGTGGYQKFIVDGAAYNGKTLYLKAYDDLDVNGQITFRNTSANLILEAGRSGSTNGLITVDEDITFENTATGSLAIRTRYQTGDPYFDAAPLTSPPPPFSAGSISINDPITFDSTGDFIVLAGTDLNVNDPISLNTTGTLTFAAGDDMTLERATLNHSSGNILLNVNDDLIIGHGVQTSPCQIGTAFGLTTINVGGNLLMRGGLASDTFAQIGYRPGTQTTATGNIAISLNGLLLMQGGEALRTYALIGHGGVNADLTPSGNITITNNTNPSISGELSLEGGSGAFSFAQIGHIRGKKGSTVNISGDISITNVGDFIKIFGGSGERSYALIGHGGLSTDYEENYSGNLTVQSFSGSNSSINLIAGSYNVESTFAGIGHGASYTGIGSLNLSSPTFIVESANGIFLESNDYNEAFIGGRIYTTNPLTTSTISIGTSNGATPLIKTNNFGDLAVQSLTKLGYHGAIIGPLISQTETYPLANISGNSSSGSSSTLAIAGSLILQGGRSTSTETSYAYLINGGGSPAGTFDLALDIGQNLLIQGGNGVAGIQSLNQLNIGSSGSPIVDLSIEANAGGDASVPAFIQANGDVAIYGRRLFMNGKVSNASAYIKNRAGNLSLNLSNDLSMNANTTIELESTSSGDLLFTSTSGDIVMGNNSSIQRMSTSNGTLSLTASSGNLSMRNMTLIKNEGDDTQIHVKNLSMRGDLSEEAKITTRAGNASIRCDGDLEMLHFSDIELGSSSTGTLSLDVGVTAGINGDLRVVSASNIIHYGTDVNALLDVKTQGFIFVEAGKDGGGLIQSHSKLNVAAINNLGDLTGDMILAANRTGEAAVKSAGDTNIRAVHMTLKGGTSTRKALIQNTAGNLTVNSGDSILVEHRGAIELSGGGILNVESGIKAPDYHGDLLVSNQSHLSNSGGGETYITSADTLYVQAAYHDDAYIHSDGPMTINAKDNLLIIGSPHGSGYITGNTDLSIATEGTVSLLGFDETHKAYIQNSAGSITVQADKDIEIYDFSLIQTTGSGYVNLVADQAFPTPPAIGGGRFYITPRALLENSSNKNLRIFTTKYDQSLLLGTLNGEKFSTSDPADKQQFSTWFDTFSGGLGDPFTVFFKADGSPTPPPTPTPTPSPSAASIPITFAQSNLVSETINGNAAELFKQMDTQYFGQLYFWENTLFTWFLKENVDVNNAQFSSDATYPLFTKKYLKMSQ